MSRWPNLNRTCAVGMLLIQAATISLLMKPIMIPVTAAAIAGWFAPRLRLLFPIPVGLSFCLVGLLGVIQHQFRHEEFTSTGFIGSLVAYEVAVGCLICQLILLFVKRYSIQLPIWFLAISGTSLVFSGDIRVSYKLNAVMLWLVAAYLLFWTGFAISCRTQTANVVRREWVRRVLIAGVILTALGSGRVLSFAYQKYANRLEFWMAEYLYHGRILQPGNGFSGRGGLHDISELKSNGGTDVALKIDADFFPDYLRGRAFTQFVQRSWQPEEPTEILSAKSDHLPIRPTYPDESVYQLTEDWPTAPKKMVVWPFDNRSSAHFFLPLNTAVLACDSKAVKRDFNGILDRDNRIAMDSYVALIGDEVKVKPDQLSPAFLDLPPRLSPVVTRTADEVFAGATTTREKIDAVESFFHNNFTYNLGLRIPRGADRLAYFLSARPPAHCEYFATATAILLRIAGVPTRYVTGYVVTGHNPVDDSYYALKQDAHAWVEAYDKDREAWVIVESTPVEGIPHRTEQPVLNATYSAGKGFFLYLSEMLRSGYLWTVGQKYAKVIIVLVPIGLILAILARIGLNQHFTLRRREHRLNPAFVPLARERMRMDRFLARNGLPRPPEESLLHFARRVELTGSLTNAQSLADWYRHYAALRFQDLPIQAQDVASIREQRQQLVRSTRVTT